MPRRAVFWPVKVLGGLMFAASLASAHTRPTVPIQHVIIIMQTQHSFDNYFGTFPGADGIPMTNGVPTVCNNDPKEGVCVAPYHDTTLISEGGPVEPQNSVSDIDGGAMDGFISTAESSQSGCGDPALPQCKINVMGYHTASEIPNYWAYAEQYVLQDHMFAPDSSYSLPTHLSLVSGWSASCPSHDPDSCTSSLAPPEPNQNRGPGPVINAWTDITYMLHNAGVSWGYYVFEPADEGTLAKAAQNRATPYEWNPLPKFDTVKSDGQTGNIQDISNFTTAAAAGTLPAVSWVMPDYAHSEHKEYNIQEGEAWVTSIVNDVMNGPDWPTSAIFITWSDWGGYYDHVPPPVPPVDANGYGIRVPGLMISPYARQGYIDSQILTTDAYLKFIEDLFLNGARLDPTTDGRPDLRPDVRETVTILGDLMQEFDFSRPPRRPRMLSLYPAR